MLNTAKWFKHVTPALIVILTLMLLSPLSSAVMLHESYSCEVKSIRLLDEDGTAGLVGERYQSGHLGSTFVIDRYTGRMLGQLKNHDGLDQPEVMDFGSDKQSLKVITTYGPYVYIDYLIVEIYVDALDKPFMFISSSTIYTGLCKGL
jgi:hypothetical protein